MYEIFKTVLTLSVLGFCLTALLLILKPVTSKKFPARWQYYAWIAVLFVMAVPLYKLIPPREAKKIPLVSQNQITADAPEADAGQKAETVIIEHTPIEYREVNLPPNKKIRFVDLAAYIWLFGACIFLIFVITNYAVFLVRLRKNSIRLSESSLLDSARGELNIKRRIRLKISDKIISPMLVGVLFPTVFIPCAKIPDDNMKMALMHELTHYKRKDLLIKWIAIFVNAAHWFNPLCYLLCANIGEACEVSCDMEVTKNMSADEQKLYMQTIIDLVE